VIRIGLHALGIGAGARSAVVAAVARAAEANGFARLWAGEHVVMVDHPGSRYPYNDAGEIPVPADADWLDPFVCLSFAAAATSRIEVATGIVLLPEHNPVLVAKQAASLDAMSEGRLTLGVGIGWSEEEFVALGVPFARRGARAVEYVRAMREIWRSDSASFAGAFVNFDRIRVYPKPPRERRLPVVFGGNTDAALRRIAAHGDGWYGFNLAGVEQVADRMAALRQACQDAGRTFETLDIAVGVMECRPSDLPELERLGVGELVLVEGPPDAADEAAAWLDELAQRWLSGHAPGPSAAANPAGGRGYDAPR
jgi:probable F420-dependent oxidoreductase